MAQVQNHCQSISISNFDFRFGSIETPEPKPKPQPNPITTILDLYITPVLGDIVYTYICPDIKSFEQFIKSHSEIDFLVDNAQVEFINSLREKLLNKDLRKKKFTINLLNPLNSLLTSLSYSLPHGQTQTIKMKYKNFIFIDRTMYCFQYKDEFYSTIPFKHILFYHNNILTVRAIPRMICMRKWLAHILMFYMGGSDGSDGSVGYAKKLVYIAQKNSGSGFGYDSGTDIWTSYKPIDTPTEYTPLLNINLIGDGCVYGAQFYLLVDAIIKQNNIECWRGCGCKCRLEPDSDEWVGSDF